MNDSAVEKALDWLENIFLTTPDLTERQKNEIRLNNEAKGLIDIRFNGKCIECDNKIIIICPWEKKRSVVVTCIECGTVQFIYPKQRKIR